MTAPLTNSAIVAGYVQSARGQALRPEIIDAAKMCFVDWMAVCIGARSTPEAQALRRYVAHNARAGNVALLTGGMADAATAALINGTLSHCLDYDDTHIPTALHASGPTLAVVLALGSSLDAGEEDLLRAFVCGFEVGASFGSGRLGVRLNERGWHSTAVLGRLGAAAACACLLQLDAEQTEDALGLAATQAGGLTASFGTMAKPFHAGKAAADGLMAARLAQAGLAASRNLFDSGKGLFGSIFQDRETLPDLSGLGRKPEILANSFKPYAACQLAHAPIDAALRLREQIGDATLRAISVEVNPLAIEIAGLRNARTPTEGRFSTGYCMALALKGHPLTPSSFSTALLEDPELAELASRVSMVANPEVERTAANVEAVLDDGRTLQVSVPHAFGSSGNPMGWPQIESKFMSLVQPELAADAATLFSTLESFEQPGSLRRTLSLVDRIGA